MDEIVLPPEQEAEAEQIEDILKAESICAATPRQGGARNPRIGDGFHPRCAL
jgi:hypothetical protein